MTVLQLNTETLKDLECIVRAKRGSLEGTEIVGPGHPDLKAAILAEAAREAVDFVRQEQGMDFLASDIKALIGGEADGRSSYPTITLSGNVGVPPDCRTSEDFAAYTEFIAQNVRKVSDEMGYSMPPDYRDEKDRPFDPSRLKMKVGLLPQAGELQKNLSEHSKKQGVPKVFGDGVWVVGGANHETDELLRAEIVLGRKLNERLVQLVESGEIYGGYDSKIHIIGEGNWYSKEYEVRLVSICKQHHPYFQDGSRQSHDAVRELVLDQVVKPVLGSLYVPGVEYLFNPAGEWNSGGSVTDMGEGCDHIFWAQMGFPKYADPQVGEDQSKADNVEFLGRAMSKAALMMLKDYGVYHVTTKAYVHIQAGQIKAFDMDFKDADEKLMFVNGDTHIKEKIINIMFAAPGMFPHKAQDIMRDYWLAPGPFMELLTRGNIYGYTPEDAPHVPWENVTDKVINGQPYIDGLMASEGIPRVETSGSLVSRAS